MGDDDEAAMLSESVVADVLLDEAGEDGGTAVVTLTGLPQDRDLTAGLWIEVRGSEARRSLGVRAADRVDPQRVRDEARILMPLRDCRDPEDLALLLPSCTLERDLVFEGRPLRDEVVVIEVIVEGAVGQEDKWEATELVFDWFPEP